jgi:hypothetical protein
MEKAVLRAEARQRFDCRRTQLTVTRAQRRVNAAAGWLKEWMSID